MRNILFAVAMSVSLTAGLSVSASAQEESTAPAEHYSVETTLVGTILDDPAAAAVLERIIPTVYANEMFTTMGRSQTLKGVQQYEPAALNDETLAQIQAEFEKLPAKE